MPNDETTGLALDKKSTNANVIEQIKAMDLNYLAMAQLTTAMGTDAL